jgi:hypothetical protein
MTDAAKGVNCLVAAMTTGLTALAVNNFPSQRNSVSSDTMQSFNFESRYAKLPVRAISYSQVKIIKSASLGDFQQT